MADVIAEVEQVYGPDCVVLAPDLPHGKLLSFTPAAEIVRQLLEKIDKCVREIESTSQIKRIVLVGHSSGATIIRRTFLVAAGKPDGFEYEPILQGEPARSWTRHVERIVLLAAFNRGWQISERMGWIYALGFNVVGLLGHILPGNLSPTIFNLRLGSPFMVQTRLHWMAHRRGERAKPVGSVNPILIQIIGTKDDLIAPIDQVDISVDGTGRALKETEEGIRKVGGDKDEYRDYFLLETAETDHKQAVVFTGSKAAGLRKEAFCNALSFDHSRLHEIAVDPGLLTDEVDLVDRTVGDVVFVIHGIRDDGFWTHRIAGRVRTLAGQNSKLVFRSWTPSYGYFAMLPFMLPWIRRQKVEWFMDQYVGAFAQYPNARFHFVGHSNGTYLAASALEHYRAFRLTNVLFAGSVVRCSFDWIQMIQQGRVQRFQNILASADWVVAWLPKSVEFWPKFDLGGAGFDGFVQKHEAISELRYVKGGHGAGIREVHWTQIANFILNGQPLKEEIGADANVYARHQKPIIHAISKPRVVMGALIVLFVLLIPLSILFLGQFWPLESSPWRALGLVFYLWGLYFFITRI